MTAEHAGSEVAFKNPDLWWTPEGKLVLADGSSSPVDVLNAIARAHHDRFAIAGPRPSASCAFDAKEPISLFDAVAVAVETSLNSAPRLEQAMLGVTTALRWLSLTHEEIGLDTEDACEFGREALRALGCDGYWVPPHLVGFAHHDHQRIDRAFARNAVRLGIVLTIPQSFAGGEGCVNPAHLGAFGLETARDYANSVRSQKADDRSPEAQRLAYYAAAADAAAHGQPGVAMTLLWNGARQATHNSNAVCKVIVNVMTESLVHARRMSILQSAGGF